MGNFIIFRKWGSLEEKIVAHFHRHSGVEEMKNFRSLVPKIWFVAAFLSFAIFAGCAPQTPNTNAGVPSSDTLAAPAAPKTIALASFNVLHLGWNNNKDLDALSKVLANYDVIGLQEVMQPEAVDSVTERLGKLTQVEWGFVLSSDKLGRSSYKEYYAVVYRKDRTVFISGSSGVWNDAGDKFEREPFYASFRSGNFDYILILMHSDFDGNKEVMRREAMLLAGAYRTLQDADPDENDLILMGDFNLSASDRGWDSLRTLSTITNLIPATALTTVSPSGSPSSAYDNIWIQTQFTGREYAGKAEAHYLFDSLFTSSTNAAKTWRQTVSDHLPVYAIFYTDKADDD